MPTALDENSKADTVFLSLGITSIATLAEDEGQYRTDLSTGASYAYEASSARAAMDESWSIEFELTFDPGEYGTLLNHGTADGTSFTYRVSIDAFANLVFSVQGGILAQIAMDNSNERDYLVFWCMRAEGSSYRSEFGVYNKTTTTWARYSIVHGPVTTNAAWQLNLGGYGAGVDVYSYGMDQFEFVRIGTRFHSAEEVALDWIGTTTPDTVTAKRRCGALPVDSSTTLADHGAFAGPSLLVAGPATRENDRRLLSPLVNEKLSSSNRLDSTYGPSNKTRLALGETVYRYRSDMVYPCPVPRAATHARVRVHADHWQSAGFKLPVYIRVYSVDRLPSLGKVLNEPPPKPIQFFYCAAAIDESAGKVGNGIWLDLGTLKLARKEVHGIYQTFIVVAWSVNEDGGDPDESNQNVRINHLTVEPFSKPLTGGQFGDYGLGVP